MTQSHTVGHYRLIRFTDANELLAACDLAEAELSLYSLEFPGNKTTVTAIDQLRAAIAKVRGEHGLL